MVKWEKQQYWQMHGIPTAWRSPLVRAKRHEKRVWLAPGSSWIFRRTCARWAQPCLLTIKVTLDSNRFHFNLTDRSAVLTQFDRSNARRKERNMFVAILVWIKLPRRASEDYVIPYLVATPPPHVSQMTSGLVVFFLMLLYNFIW